MMAFWGLLAALGALAFVTASDWPRAWSVYLVNLVFWSGLAVTGPAIAGMMQLTEARWSPSVRRLAVTTIGFLPVSFVLLVLLFAGRTVLYPWVMHPVAVKAVWLNVPFFFGGTSLLIVVGVAMDTVNQVESQLIMRHYDGFMKKTRIRGRRG